MMLFLLLLLIAVGVFCMIGLPEAKHSSRNSWVTNPIAGFIVGLLLVFTCGFLASFHFIKLFDKKPGLIINQKGITDNSSFLSVGLILWSDIEKIKFLSLEGNNFIMISVKNHVSFLSKIHNPLKRKMMRLNRFNYGGEISIPENFLKFNQKELHKNLNARFADYKKENS